jgi:catechol 2,3-dioxygenase-like lactoylglutathione lyase family enzyme
MQAAAILEAALYVSDLEQAEQFYSGVLGLDVVARAPGRHVFFRCGKGVVLLFNAKVTEVPPAPDALLPVPPHGADGPGHLCFAANAEEIETWKQKLVAASVAIEADFEWPNGGRSIYFRDPSGNSLEFAEPRIWNI